MVTTVTYCGSDQLKRQACEIAGTSGRRFPDVLAELGRAPGPSARRPSRELVLLCSGLAQAIDGGCCACPAGCQVFDGSWSWCSAEPDLGAHV
ncbi:hypothetical protein [Streptomyces canus]|uniref:hypothetical protein n=1 Tax=Streptomyces canus TaxID=58343 RepID=UPI00371C552C